MKRPTIVTAEHDIPYGARVMVRGYRAALASDELANATARPRPHWCWDEPVRAGGTVAVVMDDDLGTRSLQAIADGPIMDSNQLYLPAGRLSMDEYRRKQLRLLAGEAA